jgi:DNA-binding LacI/PurR family transcriptional regulator
MPQPTRPEGRRITMRDVAQAAGVSTAVVSLSYNHPGRVATPTRERVLLVAASIGYPGPDPTARALRTGGAERVGVMAPDGLGALLLDQGALLVLRGLGRALDRTGLALTLSPELDGPFDVHVGIRFQPLPMSAGSGVGIDPPVDLPGSVSPDYSPGLRDLVDHIAERGDRGLAIVTWPAGMARLDCLLAAWGDRGPVTVLEARGARYGDGELAARSLLANVKDLTLVVALCDPLARGIADTFGWAGLRVPDDIGVASVDDLPGTDLAGLTSVFVPYESLGERAGAVILDRFGGVDRSPWAAVPLPTSLTIRSSTGGRRRSG